MNIAVGRNQRCELQAYAKFLEGDGHSRESITRLHDREGKLAAGEETGFLAVHRDQIGLGKNLQQVLSFESLDRGAKIDIRAEDEQIQDIVESGGSLGSPRTAARRNRLRTKATELA